MPLTHDQLDEMRWEDDGGAHIPETTDNTYTIRNVSGKPVTLTAEQVAEAYRWADNFTRNHIRREVEAMPEPAPVDALADSIVCEALSWAGRVGGPFSVALDRAEAWLTVMDMSNSNARKD